MDAPASFLVLAMILGFLFTACMVTGAVWLFFGWRKKWRALQFLSALPFGIGLLVITPMLILTMLMILLWFVAALRQQT